MSVPWLMKYCLHQIYELDLIEFHISSFTRGLGKSFIKLTHNSVPQLMFVSSSLHVSEDDSARDCLLLSHWLSELLPLCH